MADKKDKGIDSPQTAYQKALDNIEDYKKRACDQLAEQWSQEDTGDLRSSCPTCGHVLAPKRRNVKRTIITSLGEVTYTRHYYTCSKCGHGFYPVDDDIKKDLGHGSMTRDITALALDFAMTDPYELAAQRFELHHGIKLSRSGFQRIVEEAGEKLTEKKRKTATASPPAEQRNQSSSTGRGRTRRQHDSLPYGLAGSQAHERRLARRYG